MGASTSAGFEADAAPVDGASFTKQLCRSNAAWAVDATNGEELPPGWRGLARSLFADIGVVMAEHPAVRLIVHGLREASGALSIELSPIKNTSDAVSASRIVRILSERVRRASEHTCSICGALGSTRSTEGRQVTRCDAHAVGSDPGSPAVPTVEVRRDRRTRQADAKARDEVPTPDVAVRDHRLYRLADIEAALGRRRASPGECDAAFGRAPDRLSPESDSDHQAYLRTLLKRGEDCCLRELARPGTASLTGLDALQARAPHMSEVTSFVRRHLAAAMAMGLPTSLPAIMLLGEPGTGKSWFMSRLAALLGLPNRRYPMNGQSLKDGLAGAHPTWRNAQPGLVAKCLLAEEVANPLVLVDEVDKAGSHHAGDPYRAFYDLLEPEGARQFTDEYLAFPLDASCILWVLAGNDLEPIPAPILDRLTVITVPSPNEAHLRAVAASVYEECNAARRSFFPTTMDEDALERLLDMNPRGIRKAVGEAMTRAAADGRRVVLPGDIVVDRPLRRAIGFR